MDITLEIIVQPASHFLPSDKHAQRYIIGDIVSVYPAEQMAIKSGQTYTKEFVHPKFNYIHVTGLPNIGVIRVSDELTRSYLDRDIPLFVNPQKDIIKKRMWNIDFSGLNPSKQTDLANDGQTTIPFGQLIGLAVRKVDGKSLEESDL